MFTATKRELGEVYAFFRLLADGSVSMGTPDGLKDEDTRWRVALVQREEHDGDRAEKNLAHQRVAIPASAGPLFPYQDKQ